MNAYMMEMLINYQMTLGRLYTVFADLFPVYRVFWATLAWEENYRAGKVLELKTEISQRRADFRAENFSAVGIKNSIDYLEERIKSAYNRSLSMISALSIARDIEKSMIYGKIFESFRGYTAKNQQLIRELGNGMKDGYQELESLWNEQRRYA